MVDATEVWKKTKGKRRKQKKQKTLTNESKGKMPIFIRGRKERSFYVTVAFRNFFLVNTGKMSEQFSTWTAT